MEKWRPAVIVKFSSNWTAYGDLPGDSIKYYFLGATPGVNYTWVASNYSEWSERKGSRYELGWVGGKFQSMH
jgi:hypothetical protein